MKTDKISFADNSFDLLRLFAALEIMWYHLCDFIPANVDKLSFYSVFTRWAGFSVQGVVILFAISGFLIPASFERSRGAIDFIKKRLTRLYPALAVSFFVTFTIIMTVYRPELDLKKIAVWFTTQLTVMQSYTPGFLRDYGSGNPNGSLWTIFTEMQMYVLVAIFYKWLKRLRLKGWIALIFCGALANVVCWYVKDMVPHIVYRLIFVSFVPYLYIFLLGMFLYFNRDMVVRFLADHAGAVTAGYLAFSVIAYFAVPKIGFYNPLYMGLLLPFVIAALAYGMGRHRLPFDLSYGIYLYHLIFVNLLIELGVTSHVTAICIVVPLTVAAAFLSHYLVEKPVQRLISGKKK
ncbi:MAG: acyltransferase [Clostridia bacterium]|nr:acyltransferase [Clostridia bacterium]